MNARHPGRSHAVPGAMIAVINRWYNKNMFARAVAQRRAGSDFHNYGYWDQNTRTLKQACENLMEKLLALISTKEGTILDVACGKGATTRHLLNYYRAGDVTGINISERQLARCRRNAPNCNFMLMDATALGFPDRSFNNVICVESAFHFNTRELFLRQAWRVLKPGGCMVLSDILNKSHDTYKNPLLPEANYLKDSDAYRNLCLKTGFEEPQIVDATYECWVRFYENSLRFHCNRFGRGEINRATFIRRVRALFQRGEQISNYVLVRARRPDVS